MTLASHAEITGDYNPLHFDEAFVANTKFGKLVVQGGLTTGILHALVAIRHHARHFYLTTGAVSNVLNGAGDGTVHSSPPSSASRHIASRL